MFKIERLVWVVFLVFTLFGTVSQLCGAPLPTNTALTMTAVSGPVPSGSSIPTGSTLTLTASVTFGSTMLTSGQVKFCDASAIACADIHMLGLAQITSSGTAVLRIRPSIGGHSYKAVFLGAPHAPIAYDASTSSVSSLIVSGSTTSSATTTAITETGYPGPYTLSATVTGVAPQPAMTGTISFQDSSNENNRLAIATLGANSPALNWINSQSSLALTYYPASVAKADFNNDGNVDFAVPIYQHNTIAIFLGNGDGTFRESTLNLPSGASLLGIVAADFNGDGKQDLAAVNLQSGLQGAVIIFGNGDGTFTVGASISVSGSLGSITTGDFNGDGLADLALATQSNVTSQSIAVLLGNGNGTFTVSSVAMPINEYPRTVLAGDFNGDGQSDLVVTTGDAVGILTGNGDGTFAMFSPVLSIPATYCEAADLNNDGRLDLAIITSSSAFVLLGQGNGAFSTNTISLPQNAGGYSSLHIGDFNGDGIPDFEVAADYVQSLIFEGMGDGTFVQTPVTPYSTYGYLMLGVADLNGDGKSGAFAFTQPGYGIASFLAQPLLTATATVSGISPGATGTHLITANYSGDPNYSASTSASVVTWGTRPATATTLTLSFGGSAVTTVNAGSVITLTAAVKAGSTPMTSGLVKFCDATVTSCADISLLGTAALTSNGTASLKFIPGVGQHSYNAVFIPNGYGLGSASATTSLTVNATQTVFPTATTISQSGSVGNYTLTATVTESGSTVSPSGQVSFLDTSYANTPVATAMLGASTTGVSMTSSYQYAFNGSMLTAIGDFSGDGIPDVATLSTPSNGQPSTVSVLLGKDGSTFTAVTGPTLGGFFATGIVSGDFNSDGKLDLAISVVSLVGQQYKTTIWILLGNGDGTFVTLQTPATVSLPPNYNMTSSVFAVADFNADGKADILVTNETYSTSILLGNGDGTFVLDPATIPYNTSAVADLNGDGIPDLVANVSSTQFVVYLGNGDGTFTQAGLPVNVGSFFYGYVSIADFNKDGIPDIATVCGSGGAPFQIFLGKGDGTFSLAGSINLATQDPTAIAAADFNSDGNLDLIISNGNNYGTNQNPAFELLIGNGDGTFQPVAVNTLVGNIGAISVADFNGDGKPDIIAQTNALSVFLVQPTQTATATASGVAPNGPAPHLVDASYPGDSRTGASISSTTSLNVQVAAPVLAPDPGTYSSISTITITDATPGATIYYSAYGAVQTSGNVQYTGPIPVYSNGTATISVYATENGYQQSSTVTANYTFNLPPASTPVISLAPGFYPGTQTVTITDSAPGVAIFYTTTGAMPSQNTTPYTEPITVSASETIAAVAIGAGYSPSAITSAQYFIGSSSASFIYTIAGNGNWVGYEGDGRPATEASLNSPVSTVVDSNGNIYIADLGNSVVRRVDGKTGIITTYAGTGVYGYSGDNGPATAAQLRYPSSVAVDKTGNLYIGDESGIIRKVAGDTGIITTYAGSSTATAVGDNGPATDASIHDPTAMALDSAGNLYIASWSRIRMVNASTGVITTVAGSGQYGYSGDQGLATNAALAQPEGVAVDASGNIYISDYGVSEIRKVTASTGIITTIAGGRVSPYSAPTVGFSGDGGPAANALLNSPMGIALDSAGNLYIADYRNGAIRKITAATGVITTIAGTPNQPVAYGGDGGIATAAFLSTPTGVAVDSVGNLYVTENVTGRIRKVVVSAITPSLAAAAPTFSVPAGAYVNSQNISISDTTPGATIYLTANGMMPSTLGGQQYHGPINVTGTVTLTAIAVAPGYLPSTPASVTYTITTPPTALINTVAGNGLADGRAVAGGAATATEMVPYGSAADSNGNIYIADPINYVVWKVSSSTGTASVVAGTLGIAGYPTTGVPATQSSLLEPLRVAIDATGNLFVADTGYALVLKISSDSGVLSVYAGGGPNIRPYGDGGLATSAGLSNPMGLALDSVGNLYIADAYHSSVRMVSAKTGIITTVAGNYGASSSLGDGSPATSVLLSQPWDLATDKNGNLYIADRGQSRVRMVSSATGIISTVAGNGLLGNSGDGGSATNARINPQGLAVDRGGNLYISSSQNIVRKIAPDGTIATIAGIGYMGFGGDGGSATVAELSSPMGISTDQSGNLYIADAGNYRVREVTLPGPAATPVFNPAGGSYFTAQTVMITAPTPGSTIYYTTDGTNPATNSAVYSSPLTISSTTTIKAIAVATGYLASTPASATYSISINNPVPTLTGISPAFISAGGPAFTMTLSGSGFTPASTVYWGTFALQTQFGSVTSLTAQVPVSDITTPGTTPITVGTPSPGGGVSGALQFEVDSATSVVSPPSLVTSAATVVHGTTANYSITLPTSATYVSVVCLNLPAGATCSYSPTTSILSVATASTTPTGIYNVTVVFTENLPGAASGLLFLPILLLPWTISKGILKTRRARNGFCLIAGSIVLVSLAACAGNGSSTTSAPPITQSHQVTSSAIISVTVL
jgi:sugar lactone lactonase YvrE